MKKNTPQGYDELNICELPLATLQYKSKSKSNPDKILRFTDIQDSGKIIRRWSISGGEYGLPTALDESIFLGLLAYTKHIGNNAKEIYFSQYELLKILRWKTDGQYYKRLHIGVHRLKDVNINVNFFWNNGKFHPFRKKGFNLLDDYDFNTEKKREKSSYIIWSHVLWRSISENNLKLLDLDLYFSLKNPISRRLYRLLDKRLYNADAVAFPVRILCTEKLGMSRQYKFPSEFKRKLEPAIKELLKKNIIADARYRGEKITFSKYGANEKHSRRKDIGEPSEIDTTFEITLRDRERIEAHREAFLQKFPFYRQFKDKESLNALILRDLRATEHYYT